MDVSSNRQATILLVEGLVNTVVWVKDGADASRLSLPSGAPRRSAPV